MNIKEIIEKKDLEAVKVWSRYNDVDEQDDYGMTALMYAVNYTFYEAFSHLIKHTENIDAQNKDGNSALILSAYNDSADFDRREKYPFYRNFSDMSVILMKKGSNSFLKNNKGKTAIDIDKTGTIKDLSKPLIFNAILSNDTKLIKDWLRYYCINDNIYLASDRECYTPLEYAVTYNKPKMVRFLLDNEADYDFSRNTKLLFISIVYNYTDVEKILFDRCYKKFSFEKLKNSLVETFFYNQDIDDCCVNDLFCRMIGLFEKIKIYEKLLDK